MAMEPPINEKISSTVTIQELERNVHTSEEIRHGDVELTKYVPMFPLIDLPKYDKVTVALPVTIDYQHDLIPGAGPFDRASRLGFTVMRNILTFASTGNVTNVRTQIRTGFNPETCSDIWVDIDNPEAPWNKTV